MLSKMKVLIVDDEIDICLYIKSLLETIGFEIDTASGYLEAIKFLKKNGYSILICDQSLSERHNHELIKWCRTVHFGYIYIISISSNNTEQDLLDAINNGADEFIPKPIRAGELITRVRVGERIMSLEKNMEETNKRFKKLYKRIKDDLIAASVVQKSLLPKKLGIKNIKMSQLFRPAEDLSGDLYNVIHHKNKLIIYHLDTSGHGIASSFFSIMVYEAISNAIIRENLINPWEMIQYLNKRFIMNQQTKQYFTIFYGVLNLKSMKLRFSQNGQRSLIYIPYKNNPYIIDSTGPPIGLFPKIFGGESVLSLKPGDKIVLFSDGLVDSKNPNNIYFGERKILDAFNNHNKYSLDNIFSRLLLELEKWIGSSIFTDDVSLLGLEILKECE